jgi:molybdopterin synthase catalytic subunit
VQLAPNGDDWVSVSPGPVPLAQVALWPVVPDCGAVVIFAGTVRDHSEGRPGVSMLEYEAYVEGAEQAMQGVAAEARQRWPELGRVALLHRTGLLVLTEVSVVVAVSAPHRPEAFAAASFAIDAVKSRVPIWKKEVWEGGASWGLDAHPVEAPA